MSPGDVIRQRAAAPQNPLIMRKIALQLYTVRNSARHDFAGTLRQVAQMGYHGIEAAGYLGGLPVKDLSALLADLGLTLVSGHVSLDALSAGFERVLDDYAALGARYIGLGWVPEDQRRDSAAWHRLARTLEKAALTCVKRDITFFHHNHDFEFERFEGVSAFDILMANSDPSLVKAELDVYWSTRASVDPSALMRKLDGRAPLIHLKDMTGDAARTFAVLGEGVIDFAPILDAGDATGVDWYVAEQDQCPRGELESARASLEYVRGKGWF